ncbi:hypothetical protein EG68_06937 [Paragonimus skrjabini miyazakii]|uniref:Uncharacterized protein n=1 Tax=Paragonimus skrjabini miyazakii TaxID=59628 RepID=A0A8S9YYD3_9TREM|nr:hypothetical protein EG68_06937 [Paragonimus skrjabini miyazakii]
MIGCAFGLWALATYTFMVRGRRIPCNLVPLLDRFVTTGSKGIPLGNNHSFIPDPENTLLDDKKVIEVHDIFIKQSSPARLTASSYKPPRPLAWDLLLRHPPFWAMLLANFAHNNSFYIILNWCPSYFHDNYPDARSWVFNMVPWLIIFPCVLLSGLIADHWIVQGVSVTLVRKTINSVVLLGSALFLLLLCVLDNYYAALTCMALALACLGFHSSGVLLNPQDIAPTHSGQLYGVMATVGTLPGFTGVYFTGYLLEATHQWSTVFLLTALVSLVGWLVYTRYGSSDPLK